MHLPSSFRNSVELDQAVDSLWNKSINVNTRNVYSTGYKCFIQFCGNHITGFNSRSFNMSKVSEDLLIYFVAHCQSVLKLKYSTIKLYLAGVRFHGVNFDNVNPLCDKFGHTYQRLQNVLNGVKKSESKPLRQKLPITFKILQEIVTCLQCGFFNHDYMDLTFQTACVLAFYGFLRCNEFTCRTVFDPDSNLCVSDINFVSECEVTVNLKATKTDIFRQGIIISLFKIEGVVCPYKLLSQLMSESCESFGGKLLELETAEENDFIKNEVRIIGNTVEGYWVGGYNFNYDYDMEWISKPSQAMQLSDMYLGQPTGPMDQLCMGIWRVFDFSWGDHYCDHLLSYICEFQHQ
ncbi:unnamed protein product [Mytilus edulis]|uniref:C-type lectin domain-containing protein n=1 Tax=Mytilus edulis TaxID=6550 RepID=A0A8S3T5E9_MYTED|nr:unnamed protein product [Mytilus edulis]